MTMYASGGTYIYYEQSGLFEGVLTTADFAPYLGTTTPLIPSGTEPLRSLPNGVCDELIVHEDGSREIIRRVGATEISGFSPIINLANGGVGCYFQPTNFKGGGNSVLIENAYYKAFSASTLYDGSFYTNPSNVVIVHDSSWTRDDYIAAYAGKLALFVLATPVIEPLPSISMPSAPSSDVTAWLDSKDDAGKAMDGVTWTIEYERSLQIESNTHVAGITRSGTTFTATNSQGDTLFTFDQKDDNTDTKVSQTLTSTNANYPLLFGNTATSSTTATLTEAARRNNSLYLNPSTGTITATNFSGKINNHTVDIDVPSSAVFTDTVTNVKGNAENSYRSGNVNLTSANIGAVDKAGDTMTGMLSMPSAKIGRTLFNAANYIF